MYRYTWYDSVQLSRYPVRPRIARYIPVRQLTGTWTGRYRVVPRKSTVDGRLMKKSTVGGRLKKKKGKEEEEKKKEVPGRHPRLRATRGSIASCRRPQVLCAPSSLVRLLVPTKCRYAGMDR
ncbi:hypothetical protein BHE74_00048560 [Ensete ventricosum]|nr:hypothetical protein BHE74_00048560 [Ensete ventricosum]